MPLDDRFKIPGSPSAGGSQDAHRIWLKLALSLAGFLSVADAQPADRIYPIVQLTDRDVAEIDVTDGSVEDWENIVGEPTLTPLDFAEPYGGSYDPSDMDFRIWLGWHDATDRIFFAMEGSTTYTSTNSTYEHFQLRYGFPRLLGGVCTLTDDH